MRHLLVCVFSVLACTSMISGAPADESRYYPPMQLYNHVYEANYDEAVRYTKQMLENQQEADVASVVQMMLNSALPNTLPYAYKLWNKDVRQIVLDYFPKSYKMVINEDNVSITNRKYNMRLKLDGNIDGDGDRLLWGDSLGVDSRRLRWSFHPTLENNRLSFTIKNGERKMLLKLSNTADSIGDRAAYGDASGEVKNRMKWALEPVKTSDGIAFHIYNQEFGLALKLAYDTDSYNDRAAWGHNGDFAKDPRRFQWLIDQMN